MSDDAFDRWKRRVAENEAAKQRAIARENGDDMTKFVEKIVERVVPNAENMIVDPAAPDGRCPSCSEPFTRTSSGRLADHVCATVTMPSEQELATQRRIGESMQRPVRHRRGSFGYDEDDD